MTPKEWANVWRQRRTTFQDPVDAVKDIVTLAIEEAVAAERELWLQYVGLLCEELKKTTTWAIVHGVRPDMQAVHLCQALRQRLNISEEDQWQAAIRARGTQTTAQ